MGLSLQGLVDFLPIRNIRTLVPQIRTLEGNAGFMHARIVTMQLRALLACMHDTV